VSWYQKVKPYLDFSEATDSEWQWHQLGYMQVCTLLLTDNNASTPPLSFFTGRMPFLPTNQQRQSTEGWAQSRRKKFPELSRLFKAINLLFRRLSQQKVNVIMTFMKGHSTSRLVTK